MLQHMLARWWSRFEEEEQVMWASERWEHTRVWSEQQVQRLFVEEQRRGSIYWLKNVWAGSSQGFPHCLSIYYPKLSQGGGGGAEQQKCAILEGTG